MAHHQLIGCEVFHRELCAVAAASKNTLNLEFVEQGLHDRQAETIAQELQKRVDAHDESGYDAILLGYGLCNNGIVGLHARKTPLVVPRAHDCITLFLGSRQRYDEVFNGHPGSYYLTSGWIERGSSSVEALANRRAEESPEDQTYKDYVERFGEDNAKYLMEAMGAWKSHYDRMVFINLGLGDVDGFRSHSQEEARKRDLEYREIEGELRLFHDLVNGPEWSDDDFLVVPPGHAIHPSYDDKVVEARASAAEKNVSE